MRNPEYQFISTDTNALITMLISAYETITKTVIRPASPERLFLQWVAAAILQERVLNNYTGNANLPSRAEGADLDALGDLFYGKTRPQAQAATSTERFHITAIQATAILVPSGTRLTDAGSTLVWETVEDAYIPIGSTYVDVGIRCQTTGIIGNGYTAGQLNTLIDVYYYYDRCENLTTSDGGADAATDDEFYELMRASQDAYSNAGAKGGYIYFAKQVSTEIADVVVNSPAPGQVNLYVLMNDGSIASTEIKNAVLAACNDEYVRPLTDYVVTDDPDTVSYDIAFTYYIPYGSSLSASEIENNVNNAVAEYTAWQSGKLGRDINPSHLLGLLMSTGIKRAELTLPLYASLRDGSDNTVPEVAQIGSITITNGGYENE